MMWTCVTLVYLVPRRLSLQKLLAPGTSHEHDLQRSHFLAARFAKCSGSLEVV